jgi:DNA polymerase III sliding clamp (beta) subunit (PCNA family)
MDTDFHYAGGRIETQTAIGLVATTTATDLYLCAKEVSTAAEKAQSQRRRRLPILTHVLIDGQLGDGGIGTLTLTCTDLRIARRNTLRANVRSNGAAVVPARLLRNIAMRLCDFGRDAQAILRHETVHSREIYDVSKPGLETKTVACNDTRLIIECTTCFFSLITMANEDFPANIENLIQATTRQRDRLHKRNVG